MRDLETLRASAPLRLITRKRRFVDNPTKPIIFSILAAVFHTRGCLNMGKIRIYFDRSNLPKRRATIRMKTCCGCRPVLHYI